MSTEPQTTESSTRKPLIAVGECLSKGRIFEIPSYQRGYIWGKSRQGNDNDTDSVTFFMDSILNGCENKEDIFLQGVTVSEQPDKIVIIDGQQRTTMIYLILLYLGKVGDFNIHYAVRCESDRFLKELKNKSKEELVQFCAIDENEPYQDIYYFKKSIRIIAEKLKGLSEDDIYNYIIKQIKFLYININDTDAVAIFTMMNGNKAEMLPEEVIKADLLRLVSQKHPDVADCEASRWDTNMIRSRYAREWDKWLHWWNKKDVQQFYGCHNVMGMLVQTLYGDKLSYEGFKRKFFEQKEDSKVKQAKMAFEKLRILQKKFEDAFTDYKIRNKIGCVLCILNKESKKSFLKDYFIKNIITDLDTYTDLIFLGVSHNDIIGKNDVEIQLKFDYTKQMLESSDLYSEDKEIAYRLLLKRNVKLDSALERKFDFSVWQERSLEHIFPQSKATDQTTELHSIGNLVLLYGHNNSTFSNKDFKEKKDIYFGVTERPFLKSRNLLHSISVFSKDKWEPDDIVENKSAFIAEFENHYKNITTSNNE